MRCDDQFIGSSICRRKRGDQYCYNSSNWLTSKKGKSFWFPYKKQYQYEQSLKKNETPNTDTWTLHKIQKVLFTEKSEDIKILKVNLFTL